MSAAPAGRACGRCLARAWLIGRLAGHLEAARARIGAVLGLSDAELIAALGGGRQDDLHQEIERFDPVGAVEHLRRAGVEPICVCDPDYPARVRALTGPPAVLHVAGGLARFLAAAAEEPVAIVGARKASPYGLEVARSLGRSLAAAGVPVVSGLAYGIDSAAHLGTLDATGYTIAVMPAGADRPYPASRRPLYRRMLERGAAVAELPAGVGVRRWMFPSRNRVIAALAAMTIVVEAGERSGALLTARFARALGRPVGAVPGRITSPAAAGPNALLAGGAFVIRGAQDVLDVLFGAGVRRASVDRGEELVPELRVLLAAIADGHDTAAALARAGVTSEGGLAALASLELAGYVRREAGGRFSIVP